MTLLDSREQGLGVQLMVQAIMEALYLVLIVNPKIVLGLILHLCRGGRYVSILLVHHKIDVMYAITRIQFNVANATALHFALKILEEVVM